MSERNAAEDQARADPRDYFAEERTFLAWIRTGLALMTFGFVVARFGLYLTELQLAKSGIHPPTGRFSLWAGITFIVSGVVANLIAVRRHFRVVDAMNHGRFLPQSPSQPAVILALFLAMIGVAMALHIAFS